MEEPLVVALELVVEDDPLDTRTVGPQSVGGPQVGAVQVSVVRQFAGSEGASVEGLGGFVFARPMAIQKLPAAFGKCNDRRALIAIQRCHDADKARRSESVEISMPEVRGASSFVVEIAQRNDAKGADRGQCPHLGPTQVVVVVIRVDTLTLEPARQIQTVRKDITGIEWFVAPRVRRVTLPTVERTGVQMVPHGSLPSGRPLFDRQVLVHAL